MKNYIKAGFVLFLFISFSQSPVRARADDVQVPLERMLMNVSPSGTQKGVVVASPSTDNPNYFFHWVRDSALTMDVVVSLYQRNHDGHLLDVLKDYVHFSAANQTVAAQAVAGIGEPRFNVDGSVYSGPWARPQNDGPALRILTLLHLEEALGQNEPELSRDALKIIRTDLDYITAQAASPCYDLWEEVRGSHFYTRAVQSAAIRAWAQFNHTGMAEAQVIDSALEKHWDPAQAIFKVTLDRLEGAEAYKHTDLDTAVLLAALHSKKASGPFSIEDDRMISTANALDAKFGAIYPMNAAGSPMGNAIGRYEGDVYFGGNPWFITTAAFAELHYRLAKKLEKDGSLKLTALNLDFFKKALPPKDAQSLKVGALSDPALLSRLVSGLRARGDHFLDRVRAYQDKSGAMSEQFDKTSGAQISARDLTWSYASLISAILAK
jgi:glucoamylase